MITRDKRNQAADLEHNSYGFTIVELMIATLVFTTILMVLTFGVIKFSAAYYKGVNSSAVQSTARNITDVISRSVQFGNSSFELGALPVGSTPGYFCVGGYVYQYKLGVPYGTPDNMTGLEMRSRPTSGSCSDANNDWATLDGGVQLLPEKMRLSYLEVSEISTEGFVTVSVGVASGDLDLLCDGGGCGLASDADVVTAGANLRCKGGTGTEYCAVSRLTTTVQKRMF